MKPDHALLILSQLIQRLTLSNAEAFAVNAALQSLAAATAAEPKPAAEPAKQSPAQ